MANCKNKKKLVTNFIIEILIQEVFNLKFY